MVDSGTKKGLEQRISGQERVELRDSDSDCFHLPTFSFLRVLGSLTRLDFPELVLGMELRGRKPETWVSGEQEPDIRQRVR